jgi:membrane protein insertase Oxa1/YidC/SpoIIIJ
VFTVIFYNIASGLVLYWLVNTVLSIAQQYYIHRGPSPGEETSRDASAPRGVQAAGDMSSSTTDPPEFVDAEVVDDEPKQAGGSRKNRGKRGRKRRK